MIDLYQLHRVDPEVPLEKSLEFLQKTQESDLIKPIGLSEVTVEQVKEAQKFGAEYVQRRQPKMGIRTGIMRTE